MHGGEGIFLLSLVFFNYSHNQPYWERKVKHTSGKTYLYHSMEKSGKKKRGGQQLPEMNTTKACSMSCNWLTVVTSFYSDGLKDTTLWFISCTNSDYKSSSEKSPQISLFIQLVTLNDMNTKKAFVLSQSYFFIKHKDHRNTEFL